MWFSWLRIGLQCGRPRFDPWVGKIPWRREWQPTAVLWPGESHGLYSPWGCQELDKIFTLLCSMELILSKVSSEVPYAKLSRLISSQPLIIFDTVYHFVFLKNTPSCVFQDACSPALFLLYLNKKTLLCMFLLISVKNLPAMQETRL